MAPEQVRGELADHRADLFALGAIFYEMLAGKSPFRRGTVAETLAAILKEDPGPLPDGVPADLVQIVQHCLEKGTAGRFQSAQDLSFYVDKVLTASMPTVSETQRSRRRTHRLLAAAGAVVLVCLIGLLWRSQRSATPGVPRDSLPTLAVLPFESLGAGEKDDPFADGITDEVRGKLAMLAGLQVIASTSSNHYKSTAKTPREVAGELGVEFLLVGRIRWETKEGRASRVRVSAELMQVSPDGGAPTTRWQQTYDSPIENIFQVQSAIAGEVARGLEVRLIEGERQRLSALPTEKLHAYEEYLQGNAAADELAGESPVALKQALAHYERAVALDERFAHAWAMVSQAYSTLHFLGTPDPVYGERAKTAAERALALDPTLPAARRAMGDCYVLRGKGFRDAALEQYQLGLRYAPSDSPLLRGLADWLQSAGRLDEAITVRRRVRALDPQSSAMARLLADNLLWHRRYAEALEAAEAALRLDARSFPNLAVRTMVQLAHGDLAGARAVLRDVPQDVDRAALAAYMASFWDLYWVLDDVDQETLLRLTPTPFGDDRLAWAMSLAQTADLRGDVATARRYLKEACLAGERVTQGAPDAAWEHSFLGLAYAYLGRTQEAIHNGERGHSLSPVSEDAYWGVFPQHYLARIYVRVGQPERALDLLEDLSQRPSYLSPGWLRIDPEWAILRDHPRFKRLTAEN